ncbi:MAG: SulP family inorganic anion transporter [Ekhidna sp.]|nr:SulP family inorganic anion transporter [Ekhidna sp.]
MENKSNNIGLFGNIKTDLSAALVVFLVAVPLCLGIALASGAPLFAGIISGIVGGVVVGMVSGSQVGVSGPAAGLTVIVLGAIQDLQTYPVFLAAVVVSGIFQVFLGLAKAGIIGYYFPNSVIKGMLSAIGIIIILKQIPHAFGYDADPEGDLEFFQPDGENTFTELITMLNFVSEGALIIFFISMSILVLWEQKFIKKIKAFRIIQGPLVAVIAGILINLAFTGSSLHVSEEHMVSLPVAETLSSFWSQFTLFDISAIFRKDVLIIGATIAVVGSLETLLCVEAADKLDTLKRITPKNRELVAQGVGNTISGIIGGLPVTQVIVRSSANIQSGGKTKLSAITHGVLLLVCAILIPDILNLIPLSCLAAILIVVGYKLAKPSFFKQMINSGRDVYIPFLITIVGIIFTDLLIGIVLGLAVGIFQVLYNNFKQPYQVRVFEDDGDHKLHLELSENLTFLNKASMIETISHIPNDTNVIIDASRSHFIHPDILEIIEDFKENAKYRNITLEIIGFEDVKTSNQVRELKKMAKKIG